MHHKCSTSRAKDIAVHLGPWHCKHAARMSVKLKKTNCKVKLPGLNAFQLLSDDGIANVLLTKLRNLKLPPERSRSSTVLSVSGCFLVRLEPVTLHFQTLAFHSARLISFARRHVCYLYSERDGETVCCLKMRLGKLNHGLRHAGQ